MPFALIVVIAIIIISCPIFIAITAHLTIKIGHSLAKKQGIGFKNSKSFAKVSKTRIVATDKVGIITEGNPVVTEVFSADHFTMSGYAVGGYSDDELLEVAASLAAKSEHPFAKAITKYTNEMIVELDSVLTNYREYPEKGLEAEVDGVLIRGGTLEFIEEKAVVSPEVKVRTNDLIALGRNLVFFSKGKRLLGIISVADNIKDEAKQAIADLKDMGIETVMISADNNGTDIAIANIIGIDSVVADVTTDENVISLQSNIGIKNTDDMIVEDNSLLKVARAIKLSKIIAKKLYFNLILACVLNLFCIPFIAIAVYCAVGLPITIIFAVAALVISCGVLVTNVLRLKRFEIKE